MDLHGLAVRADPDAQVGPWRLRDLLPEPRAAEKAAARTLGAPEPLGHGFYLILFNQFIAISIVFHSRMMFSISTPKSNVRHLDVLGEYEAVFGILEGPGQLRTRKAAHEAADEVFLDVSEPSTGQVTVGDGGDSSLVIFEKNGRRETWRVREWSFNPFAESPVASLASPTSIAEDSEVPPEDGDYELTDVGESEEVREVVKELEMEVKRCLANGVKVVFEMRKRSRGRGRAGGRVYDSVDWRCLARG